MKDRREQYFEKQPGQARLFLVTQVIIGITLLSFAIKWAIDRNAAGAAFCAVVGLLALAFACVLYSGIRRERRARRPA